MDLNAAKDANAPGWKGIRLIAMFFFAIAGALLVASLVAPAGVRAHAGPAVDGSTPAPPLEFASVR